MSYRRYTSAELDDFEACGELFVCPHCDHHGHADDFGERCPVCGEVLDEGDVMAAEMHRPVERRT